MDHQNNEARVPSLPGDEDFIRLPGLFRRWEFEQLVDPGVDFHVEDAGEASDGTPLFAVYRRQRATRISNPNPNPKEQ